MLSDRDRHRLGELDPRLSTVMTRVLEAMAVLGFRMMVTEARRTAKRQQELYAQGRSTPGPIVTHLDGVAKRSKHQDGLAVDCCFLDSSGHPTWALEYPWEVYGAMVRALGLTWGGEWKMRDMPHAELNE